MSLDLLNHLQIIRLRANMEQHEAFRNAVVHRPFYFLLRILLSPLILFLRPIRHYIRGRKLAPYVLSNHPIEARFNHKNFEFEIDLNARNSIEFKIKNSEATGPIIDQPSYNKNLSIPSNNRKLIIIHAYYELEARVIFDYLKSFSDYDIVLTTSNTLIRAEFLKRFDPTQAACMFVPNIGRDVFPFLVLLNTLDIDKYTHFIKVHGKRSGHLSNGGNWFQINIETLIGNKISTDRIFDHIPQDLCAIYGVECLPLQDHLENNRHWLEYLLKKPVSDTHGLFIPGTMFAGSIQFLRDVAKKNFHLYKMEEENGQLDGCLPHALERYFGYITIENGGECRTLEDLALNSFPK